MSRAFFVLTYQSFGFGIGSYAAEHPGVNELLGVWYIPVTLALGGILLQVTTLAIRRLLRLFARTRSGSDGYWSGNTQTSLPI
jgi:hypothetical protein